MVQWLFYFHGFNQIYFYNIEDPETLTNPGSSGYPQDYSAMDVAQWHGIKN